MRYMSNIDMDNIEEYFISFEFILCYQNGTLIDNNVNKLKSPEFSPRRDAEHIQSIRVLSFNNEFRKVMALRVSQEKFREGIS